MNKTKFVVIVALLVARAALAADTVEDRKAVMDAQIDLVKKQKDLKDALRALAGSSAQGLPVVVSVTIGNERIARLQLPNGIVSQYREGEAIQRGMVVSAIAPKQVFVAVSNGRRAVAVPLEFAGPVIAGAAQTSVQQSIPDAMMPQPPQVVVPAIEVIPAPKPASTAAVVAAQVKAGK
jgi:Arc/MetJ family transcription regulator